uniref:Uncharacterized protein n=1 Tax=candidate division WWE3 bacterium TaxID=2053526 RepID=A0A7C4XI99_UNCKA
MSECFQEHIASDDECKDQIRMDESDLDPDEDRVGCTFYRCDLERNNYGFIATLQTTMKASQTQERALAGGDGSTYQTPIDGWAGKMCDIAKMFASPYGGHICSKVLSMVDFGCSHCTGAPSGVDAERGMGGEPQVLYRTSTSPDGGGRTKPYKEIVYHCNITMPDGALKPRNDEEILPIGGGDEISEAEKIIFPTDMFTFSKFPLQWRKKIPPPIPYVDYDPNWDCPVKEFFECSGDSALKQRYFSKYPQLSTDAEVALSSQSVKSNVLNVYAELERSTGLPCEVIAGIHFAEGDNNDYQSMFDGDQIDPASFAQDAQAAVEHFLDIAGGLPRDFESLVKALSEYNGTGNLQCSHRTTETGEPLTYYNHCPADVPYTDDTYVTNLLSGVFTNMSIIYPLDRVRADEFCNLCEANDPRISAYPTLCGECPIPLHYDKPGSYTAALYFYLNGFLIGD